MNDDVLLAQNKLDIGITTHVMLRRGQTLTAIKENRIYLGRADTWDDYLSNPDVRSDARECMDLYNFYIIEHKLPAKDIEEIHHDRLLEAMKAIKNQPEKLCELIEDCRVLSWKDLINKVRKTRGRKPMSIQQATSLPSGSSCICHPTQPAEQAHWPITKRMGGKNTLPLCRKCHTDLHQQGDITWYSNNKRRIGEWLAAALGR